MQMSLLGLRSYQTRWGLMEDFRVAKSTDFLYEVENVFLRLNSEYVVLTKSWLKKYELNNIVN